MIKNHNYKVKTRFLWQEAQGIFFPKRCVLCDGLVEPGERGIHGYCKTMLFPTGKIVCYRCGRPLVSGRSEFCYDCSRKKDSLIREGRSLFLYQGEIKGSMYRFKYNNRRCYSQFFGEEIEVNLADWIRRIGVQAVVPVPMYWKKEQLRGFNQAAVIGKEIARRFDLKLEKRWVLRMKNTRPMKELSDIERKNNLKNAFQIRRCSIKYKKVLLVDDIYTTGATADAIAEVLHEAGVEEVYFLSICIGKGA